MVDPKFPPFVIRSLASQNSNPKIPDEYFTAHLQGNNELTKLKLTSDASDKTWKVKLNGRRFAGGWEDFSAAHCLRDDDALVFTHEGGMVFHVTPSGRSFSRFSCISSSSDGSEDNDDSDEDDDDDDEEDSEDEDDDDDNDDSEDDDDDSDSKKKSRSETESFSSEKFCLLAATPSNLRLNRLALSKPFTRANDLNNRCCEMDLMNLTGKKSWTVGLRYNPIAGQALIQGGWKRFCRANKLKTRSLYRFKLVKNGRRPVLELCSHIIPEGSCSKSNGKAKQNKFLKVTFKPYMLHSRQIRLPIQFMKVNGIKEGEITLVDKNGVEWPSYAAVRCRGFYMNKNFKRFCEANGIETGDTFTLEFVRGEGTTPILKFYSKTKAEIGQALCDESDEEEEAQEDTKTHVQKKARVFTEGGPSHCPRSSNISNADPRQLRRKEQLQQPCSISDQLAKVKRVVMDTLIGVRGLQSEIKMKEQKIKMSLQDIDALGEKVLEIKQFFE